jgi:bacteriocin-like protein
MKEHVQSTSQAHNEMNLNVQELNDEELEAVTGGVFDILPANRVNFHHNANGTKTITAYYDTHTLEFHVNGNETHAYQTDNTGNRRYLGQIVMHPNGQQLELNQRSAH